MNFIADNIGSIVLVLINIVAIIGAYHKLKGRVGQTERSLKDIEDTRLRNVAALREIYDAKVMDAKQYAKGLFEIREVELKDLGKRMGILEVKFDKQAELLSEKFNQLIKSNAFIEAHIKTCPNHNKKQR